MITNETKELLDRCIRIAAKKGCPMNQTESFIKAGYIPWVWQWEFHSAAREADIPGGPVDIGVGGARGPGKSHAVMSQVGIDDCQ